MHRTVRRFLGSLRTRLVLAFALVVAIALALVLASLPRLLGGYFERQEEERLANRAGVIGVQLARAILGSQRPGTSAPRPILQPTEPLSIAPNVVEVVEDAEELTQQAQADITVLVAVDPAHPDDVVWTHSLPFDPANAPSGARREQLSSEWSVRIPDYFWTQTNAGAPDRLVTIRLSNPYTFRAQTLETIVGVTTTAAAVALIVAVVASILLADRLANPIRRLTGAARALSEGRLDARVADPDAAPPEIAELNVAFNAMAERLESSIQFIRRDRDRSREFLADVSHELRTPIAALRTFNELLTEGAVDEQTHDEFLDESRQQIDRLDWLATNLLEMSKLDSGLVRLDLRTEDMRAVVESAVHQAQPDAERKGVTLGVELPAEPLRQRHDAQRLGQVLSNLIGNAVKFTPNGGRVEVALRRTAEGAEIRVADTGVGIDTAELPQVFERFYRGSRAHESRAAGSGLGLSIARSIVEMHQGRISIRSAIGEGTEVEVDLPNDVSLSSPAAARP